MGMLKKVGIFLGIKYKPLSDPHPPPPIIKICEWGPWEQMRVYGFKTLSISDRTYNVSSNNTVSGITQKIFQ